MKKPGHFEELWIEENLMKSFKASDGQNGNALGTAQGTGEEKGGDGEKKSALQIFGISRPELEKVGLTDKKSQDRVYRTLTIWSSSMYDSLYTIANGKKEIASRLWNAYTRLAEVVNPNANISNNEIREEFETSLKSLHESLEKNEMQKEEQQTSFKNGLKELDETKESLRNAQEEIAKLKQELTDADAKIATLSTDWMEVKTTCDERDKTIVELNGEKMIANNELSTTKHTLELTEEQLDKKKKEVMKYVDMYMKADNEMKSNEGIVTNAGAENDRMKTKMAQYMKDNSDLKEYIKELEQMKVDSETKSFDLKKSEAKLIDTNKLSKRLIDETMPKFIELCRILSDSESIMMDIVDYCEGHFSSTTLVDNSSAGDFKTSGSKNAQHLAHLKYQVTAPPVLDGDEINENAYYSRCTEWVKKISSTNDLIDREIVKHDLEVLEKNIELHVNGLDDVHQNHKAAISTVYAKNVMSNTWMNQYVSSNNAVLQEIQTNKKMAEEVEEAQKKQKAAEDRVVKKDKKISDLKKIEQKYIDMQQDFKNAMTEKDSALLKYKKTAQLEKENEELNAVVDQLKENEELLSQEANVCKKEANNLAHQLKKKEEICDLGNSASVAFLNLFNAISEENKLQLKAFEDGFNLILEDKNVDISTYKQSAHFHHKRDVINDTPVEVISVEERTLLDQVLSNVEDLWPALCKTLSVAGKTIGLKKNVKDLAHELDSLKQWAQRERERQAALLDETLDESKAEGLKFEEDEKQFNKEIKKLKNVIDDNKIEKQAIFDHLKEIDRDLQNKKKELADLRVEYNIPEPEVIEVVEEVVEEKVEDDGIDWDAISDDEEGVEVREPEGVMPSNKSPRPGH